MILWPRCRPHAPSPSFASREPRVRVAQRGPLALVEPVEILAPALDQVLPVAAAPAEAITGKIAIMVREATRAAVALEAADMADELI